MGDDLIEVQQFHSVRVGEVRSNLAFFKGLALGLSQKKAGGQLANVGGVILKADLFGLPIDRNVGIEAAVVINASFSRMGRWTT